MATTRLSSSYQQPYQPRVAIPSRSLPAPRNTFRHAVSSRGHPNKGTRASLQSRGKPLTVTVVAPDDVQLVFGSASGVWHYTAMPFTTLQTLQNSPNPLREFVRLKRADALGPFYKT
jgi:hypothetical protein